MAVEEAIQTILAADVAVSALIVARIYPSRLPDGATYPAIVYQRISGPRLHDLSGPSGYATPRIQLDLWAATYSEAKALAEAVREALDGYQGVVGAYRIGECLMDGETDLYEPGVVQHRIVQDYIVGHDE